MSTRALAKAPQTASEPTASRPRVLVTGESAARIRAILRSLEALRAELISVDWHEYPEKLDRGFAAMVLAEPLPVTLAGAVAAVRGHPAGERLALYALVGKDSSSRAARNVYRAGATAVIEWPREKAVLSTILAETMGMSIVRGHSTRPDVALARTVRAHLRLGPSPGSSIRLSTKRGVVTASGEARSLADLQKIVETIAAVPGVKQVLTTGLRVAPSSIPDGTIKKSIEGVIRATSEIDDRSLSVSVRAGRVKLRGLVPDRSQLLDVVDLVASVKGVRDLDWEVTISGKRSEADAAVARRLRKAIMTLYPEEKIEIAVLAGVAILSGGTRSLVTKRAMERRVARDDAVSRVVNKITVTGS